MASRIYNKALARMLELFLVTGRDVRAALVMANTTVDTEVDAIDFMDDFTTLDECNGANYQRAALTSEVATEDDTNDRGEFDAANLTWTSLGASTRTVVGVLFYEHVTDDSDSQPIMYLEFPSAVTLSGNNFQVQFSDDGIMQAQQA